MGELASYSKADLILLANDCEVEITGTDGARSIIKKIKESPDFDNDFVLKRIKVLNKDRLEREEKESAVATSSLNSSIREKRSARSLKNEMHKFDMDSSDMTQYLNLFERQAKMADIEETEWVNLLLGLLPVKFAEQIIKLPADQISEYDFVKA